MSEKQTDGGRVIRGILFADVKGFSALPESKTGPYIELFLGGVAGVLERSAHSPLARNTWGDAIFLVYEGPRETGLAALELRTWLRTQKWPEILGRDLTMRIGLHAGPVYEGIDPIIGKQCYMGRHTTRAARIEPIADEGQIFVSEEFAALAASDHVREFHCEYQGKRELPKKAGLIPVYRLVAMAGD